MAADSLATLMSAVEVGSREELDCPHCANRVMIDDVYEYARSTPPCPVCSGTIDIPKISRPRFQSASSTLSFAQKLFPFLDVFGVAAFGLSALGNKTLFNHLKGFERRLREQMKDDTKLKAELQGVSAVAGHIRKFCEVEFERAFPVATRPPDLPALVFGLQVVGYDGPDDPAAKTVELLFGKQQVVNTHEGLGITIDGDIRFPTRMLAVSNEVGMRPIVENLSLQDAIDYADFLVSTTATVQRFANMIPSIGGAVDIALITNYSEFRWIRCKPLARVLEPRYVVLPVT